MKRLGLMALIGIGGCGDDSDNATTAGGSSGSASSTTATTMPSTSTTAAATTTTAGGSGGSSSGTDTGVVVDTGTVRFIAMGDGGEGNPAQFEVANAVEMVCAARGCDFAIYLGDNFYDVGVDSNMDIQFTDKFEMPYMDLDFPFHVVLGNHDYGTLANEWGKSQFQIEYTEFSTKWTLPSEWYTFKDQHVQFFGLDTAQLMWDNNTEEQQSWLGQELAASDTLWKISFSHHPYISNGRHGNAGNYEGLPGLAFVSGVTVKEVFDQTICDRVDIHFSGHDHNRQWLMPQCGTEFIVSGAAAKTTGLEGRDGNQTFFEDDQIEGFMWVEIIDDQMTGIFFDSMGNVSYERTITKAG